MKLAKFAICSLLYALCICVADAAYPVNQAAYQQQPVYIGTYQPQPQIVYQQPAVQPVVQQVVVPTDNRAVSPTRITGTLPRVGSNATNAGRQYYEPQDYDRLADSGIYIGLSAGYSASINGGMTADYASDPTGFFAPGAFEEAAFKSDTVIPLSVSLGAAINNDLRADFSYTRYSNISYPDTAMTSDGLGGLVETQNTGGAITANAIMLNIYYNVDSYTGYLMGGSLRPYIGAGVGIALNSISDYVVFDGTFYSECNPALETCDITMPTGISDIYAYHNGGTTENLAYMLEGGITADLSGGLKLDFFVRYSGVGKVKSSGSIEVSQTEWLWDGTFDANGDPVEYESPIEAVQHYTNWHETGNLSTLDLGVRLRLQF